MPLLWRFDPRLKILLALWYSLWTWHLAPLGALILAGVLLVISLIVPVRDTGIRLRSALIFVGFWVLLKLGIDFFWPDHTPLGQPIWQNGLVLGVRLMAVVLIGYLLTGTATQTEAAKAAGFLLKPVAFKNAWKVALALALMLHFIPLVGRTAADVRQAVRLRCPKLSWSKRTGIMVRAVMRILGQSTWDHALALASRDLDRPEAWTGLPRFQPLQVLTILALAAPVLFML